MRSSPSPVAGGAYVALVALVWAAFCWQLAERDHAPSVTLLAIDDYYRAQALFLVPVLLGCWLLLSAAAHAVARALGGTGSLARLAGTLGVGYAAVLGVVFVLPDIVTFSLFGFAALAQVVRVTGGLTAVLLFIAVTLSVRRVHTLTTGRALLAALAGVLAQSLLAGPLLR